MSTVDVRRWAIDMPRYGEVNPNSCGLDDYDLWKEHQRGCVRSTRAVVALSVPCGYGLVAGLLSLTPLSAGFPVSRYAAALIVELPVLAVSFVLLVLIGAVVEWISAT